MAKKLPKMSFNFNSISLASRVALWLGVALVVVSYTRKEVALLAIGGVFIAAGGALWAVYGNPQTSWQSMERWAVRLAGKIPGMKTSQWFYNMEARLAKKMASQNTNAKQNLKAQLQEGHKALKTLQDTYHNSGLNK